MTVSATDTAGNSSTGSCQVAVDHDSAHKAIEDDPVYVVE